MITLTIQISDKDRDLFEQLAKRLNVKIIKVVEDGAQPNSITKKAIADARSGKTRNIEDLDLFFKKAASQPKKATFNASSLDTRGFKFNRDEANKR